MNDSDSIQSPQSGKYTKKILDNIIKAADAFSLFESTGCLTAKKRILSERTLPERTLPERISSEQTSSMRTQTESALSDAARSDSSNGSENKYISSISSLLVGFSGGADSTALLHALILLSREKYHFRIYALHLNHCIRGAEADRDQIFCENFCKEHGITLFSERADIPAEAKKTGESVEEAARRIRYSLFEQRMRENGIERIATAHNAGDNLETMLFNLARGSGSAGLSGIPPFRGNVVRPLIFCSKADIIEYCNENGTGFVTDSTNSDTAYTRNFIRSEIIPRMKSINPQLETAAKRLCEALRQDDDFIMSEAVKYIDERSVNILAKLHPALLARVIIKKYASFSTGRQLSAKHISDTAEGIYSAAAAKPGIRTDIGFDLPGEIRAEVRNGSFNMLRQTGTQAQRKAEKAKTSAAQYEYTLRIGENIIPEAPAYIYIAAPRNSASETENQAGADEMEKYINQHKNIYKLFIHTIINFDRINGNLYVQNRADGDRIFIHGMNKSVKKLLSEAKYPPSDRAVLPIFRDDNGIVFIPGITVQDTDKGFLRDGVLHGLNEDNALHIFLLYGKKEKDSAFPEAK